MHPEADHPDNLRHPANSSWLSAGASRPNFGTIETVCAGTATNSNPAMRLPSHPGNTNDRLEGRRAYGRISVR